MTLKINKETQKIKWIMDIFKNKIFKEYLKR
jgi:hypothetical protein